MIHTLQRRAAQLAASIFGAILVPLTLLVPAPAQAQDYPAGRSISIIVGYAAGSGIDVLAREVAGRIAETLRTSVVVENKIGANSALANDYVARSSPDGYTMLILSTSGIINEVTTATRTKVARDFEPVAFAGAQPYAIAVPTDFPARNMAELIAIAKAKPNQINYSSLLGGLPQFIGEILSATAGIQLVAVPYKSTPESQVDVIAGRVPIWITPAATAINVAKSGRVRVLAITSEARIPPAPDVPTMKESGLDALSLDAVYMFLLPKGTPPAIVARLNREINAAITHPRTVERLASLGVQPKTGSSEDVARSIQTELARWEKVVAASKKQ